MVEGSLSTEEVHNDNGNGCFTFVSRSFKDLAGIVITGPQRKIMHSTGIDGYEASPGGDMMITGALGLVRAQTLNQEKLP